MSEGRIGDLMAWTSTQKQLAVRACRAAGISNEQRVDLILRHFEHAHYQGRVTSTAPKLTNGDLEAFMAIVERFAGGQLLHFGRDYWQACGEDGLSRMRGKVARIVTALESAGKLAPEGAGLFGWTKKRVSGGATDRLENLEYHGLMALIVGLEAYARQNTDPHGSAYSSTQTTFGRPNGSGEPG